MSRLSAGPSITLDKRSKILLGVLGVVVLIAAAYFLLKGGAKTSNDAATGPVVVPSSSVKPKASAVPTPTVTPLASPIGVAAGTSTRDPFAPLAAEVAATTSTAPTPATASPTPPAATATATASPSASSASGSHDVTLVSITGSSAVLKVDGAADVTVKAGDNVGSGVACIKITADSVFVTYNSKAYAIAPGQTISV